MPFDSKVYGSRVAQILALDQDGNRLIPLVSGRCSPKGAIALLAQQKASDLFSRANAPDAGWAGLWVYFSCFEQGHEAAQEISTPEGSFWHGILHRQEPDAGNAAYWFRQVGAHPIFPALAEAASDIAARQAQAGFRASSRWDPFYFIDYCERARQVPGDAARQAALEIQRAEWQLLFDYCARPRS
ncbi:MAG TPA: hypothetical protein VKG79_17125 [Bryobacteraceae bacterium]|nr:hypothetical protein [Bryobacteraceae bacterium]